MMGRYEGGGSDISKRWENGYDRRKVRRNIDDNYITQIGICIFI